jgi:alpha-D-xyloside xylohydrolase
MPEWMFGYIHCRERYSSSDEILENAEGFKSRNIPLDVIVQDWQWWGKYGWNALRFDEDHYPDPKALTDALHKDNVHLMLSVWSKVDRNSVVGKALAENGYYIDGTDWIDFFNPDAAGYYCQNFLDSLGRFGIDSWWFDATEPENDDLAGRKIGKDGLPGEFYRNVYPLMVNKTMYTGLKSISSEEPSILTRSAFSGIQRYGVVTWSGDVGNDFGTLQREIAGGLGQMATGLPWWTFDAGGFFRPSDQYQSEEYQERMLRWIQVGCFLPFMRVHGYMSRTEPWRYSEKTQEIFVKYINLRKSLQPYIVDCARKVSKEGYTLMRPLLFDFKDDQEALAQESEYMFGPKYLVCPVLEAGVTTWKVYLPKNDAGWEDFWTSEHYEGGKYYDIPVSLETIPVFVKL